jgi:hypothetical protein
MTSDATTQYRRDRKALVILGMHRSGTSLLAWLLHQAGAELPKDVLGPGPGNPCGHWEPINLVGINDEVFRSLNTRWDDVRPIRTSWFQSEPAASFVERIRRQIASDYGASDLLLIKDPRICRLLPLYLAALGALQIEPLIILQLRPAHQVIESLANRDGLERELSALLWVRSILEAERCSRGCRRVWMTLDAIVASPGVALEHIAAKLGVCWPNFRQSVNVDFDRISAARRSDETAHPAPEVAQWLVPQVWTAVEHALSGDERRAESDFDTLRLALDDMDQMYATCFRKLYAEKEVLLGTVLRSTSWRITAPLRALKRFEWRSPRAR